MTITKRKKRVVIGLLTAMALVALTLLYHHQPITTPRIHAPAPLLFVGDFETGDFTGFYSSEFGGTVVTSPTHPVRAGSYSARFYLERLGPGYGDHAMVIAGADDEAPPETRGAFLFTIGQEYWAGFSIYIPDGYVIDPEYLDGLFWQCQALPDSGESYRSPCIGLREDSVLVDGKLVPHWRVTLNWDTRAYSPGSGYQHTDWEVYLADLTGDIGQWTDWVVHVIWDYDDDGLLQMWKNDVLVVDRTGGNCSNDDSGPFVSLGAYKWAYNEAYHEDHNSDNRLVYFDEFRIGDASATYEDVAPPGAFTPIPTPLTPAPTPTPTAISPSPTPTSAPAFTPTPTPTATPGGEWWEHCTPCPTYPVQPTYTPRPTPTCRPCTSPTPYPTATLYPPQPTP